MEAMAETKTGDLRSLMLTTSASCETAKRRLWWARDEVARLERDLSIAQRVLSEAERDYEESHDLLQQNWDFFRSEYEQRAAHPDASSSAS